jgi:SAM-dependent methyltransferase
VTASTTAGGTGPVQGRLWSARARDWAEVQEATVGCGDGRFLRRAADRSADVAGLDAAPALVAIARERLPGADLREGEMERLPWADGSFDAVSGINAFQYAARPVAAAREAARVLRRGGLLAIATWGRCQDCEAAEHPGGRPGPRITLVSLRAGWPTARSQICRLPRSQRTYAMLPSEVWWQDSTTSRCRGVAPGISIAP